MRPSASSSCRRTTPTICSCATRTWIAPSRRFARLDTSSLSAPERQRGGYRLHVERALDPVEEGARDHRVAVGVRMEPVGAEEREVAVERGVDVDNRHLLGRADLLDAIVEHRDETGAA